MPTYIMLSTLTAEGVQTVKNNPNRIKEVNRELEQIGAKVLRAVGDARPVRLRERRRGARREDDGEGVARAGLARDRALRVAARDPDRRVHRRRSKTLPASAGNVEDAIATEPGTTTQAVCYRHPSRETAVSCSNCERPICTDCMVYTPVGIKCPECARQPRSAIVRLRPDRAARAVAGGARRRRRDGRRDRDPAGHRPLLRADPRLADRDRDGRGRARARAAGTARPTTG